MDQNSNSKKLMSMLGMCRKAGRLALGSDAVLKTVRGSGARLVLISSDASDRTTKQLKDKCAFYGVTAIKLSESSFDIGRAVGKSAVAVCAVTDSSLASAILKIVAEDQI